MGICGLGYVQAHRHGPSGHAIHFRRDVLGRMKRLSSLWKVSGVTIRNEDIALEDEFEGGWSASRLLRASPVDGTARS